MRYVATTGVTEKASKKIDRTSRGSTTLLAKIRPRGKEILRVWGSG
jgi:hypothetical protein